MVNVVIRGERAAWGVLEMDFRQRRDFNEDDISFLQNFANLLAAAIERLQTEMELKDAADRGSILLGEPQHRVRNMLLNVRYSPDEPRRQAQASSNLKICSSGWGAGVVGPFGRLEPRAGSRIEKPPMAQFSTFGSMERRSRGWPLCSPCESYRFS